MKAHYKGASTGVHSEYGQQTASGADSDAICQVLEKFGAGQVLVRCWERTEEVPDKCGLPFFSLSREGS